MTTTPDFDPQASFEPDAATLAGWHRYGCRCARHARRGFGQRQPFGHRQAYRRFGQAIFGIAATRDQGADLLAVQRRIDPGPARDDCPRNLQPRDRRGARRG